jgi:hypothetical protein
MGRKAALFLTIPISTHYPIVETIPVKVKEDMEHLGLLLQ